MKNEKYERASLIITSFGENDVIATSVDSDPVIRQKYEVKPLEFWVNDFSSQ